MKDEILEPVFLQIYVSKLSTFVKSKTIQDANDTAIYRGCEVSCMLSIIKKFESNTDSHFSNGYLKKIPYLTMAN